MKGAAYGVETVSEARRDVQELAIQKVDLVKIYVDDRNGTVPKLRPELYRAIIDEAHKNSLRVVAHVFYLEDAKDLVRSGVDGFSHLPRGREVDDEFVSLMKQHNVFVIPSLWLQESATLSERPPWFDDPSLHRTVAPEILTQWGELLATRNAASIKNASDTYQRVQRSLARLNAAGVRIAFGSDYPSPHFVGYSEHRELELMVRAGMTPAQAIIAATRTSAEILRLDQSGTIAPGKSADFIVLDADPLSDIANTRRIWKVYLRGDEVDRATIRDALGSASPR